MVLFRTSHLQFPFANRNMADKWVELSDEQIEQLLSEAEARLSAQADDGKSLSKSSKPNALQVSASADKPSTAVALKATQPAAAESKSKGALSVRIPEARKGSKEKVCHLPDFPCFLGPGKFV